MREESNILEELVKAKESIKRKYTALKNGEADVQQLVTQTFKPVIEPLTKISNTRDLYTNQSTVDKGGNKLGGIDSGINENDDVDNDDYYQQEIENWFQSADIDKTYGPKKLTNGDITLGDREVKFTRNLILFDGASYPATSGLIQLLFLKNPLIYTGDDLKTYKSILIHTSAHLTAGGSKIKNTACKKFKNIISRLFPSGGELYMKVQRNNLVYWDDPNELVDRLRLLVASKSAGNTGVSNEIISIFEELREAGLIKRIPNV